ncbi:MAG: DUF2911 domain-containing protein [Verrucomicrobia bacterium]|nr:DUF2911 domain-containing protein [Verrucomicrobiota bacterium]
MNLFRSRCTSLALAGLVAASAFAQSPAPKVDFPAPSPTATLKQRVGLTDIEIVYSRPGMKGRKVFGGLVAWGETWRAGANNATTVSFSTPVRFGGKSVPAGKYALFAKVGQEEWTVILSTANNQWGSYRYDPKDDVARVTVKAGNLGFEVETLLIDLNNIRDESAVMNIVWESTFVAVPIEVDVVKDLVPQIETLMASNAEKKPYLQAAMFYLDHNLDLKKALAWADAAIAATPSGYYIVYRKAKIQAAMGDKAGAIATAQKSIEMAKKDKPGPLQDEYVRLNEGLIASLK